jgi:O-antigen/teichoic acid export membrane protein
MQQKMWEILMGSSSYFISSIVSNAATFVVALLVSWYLGKEGVGLLSVSLTLILIGSLLSDLGINSFAIREYSSPTRPPLMNLRSLVELRFVAATLVATCLAAAASIFLQFSHIAALVLSSALLIVFRSVTGVLESFLKARQQRRQFFILAVVVAFSQVVFVFLALHSGGSVSSALLILAGTELGRCVALMIMVKDELMAVTPIDTTRDRIKQTLLQSTPFAFMALLSTATDRADLFLLAGMLGTAQAGVYAAADRFLMIGNLVEFALFASLFPILSSLTSRAQINELTLRTSKVMISIAVVGSIILFAGAPLLVRFTFRFPESILLLRILSLALPGMIANSLFRVALFSLRQERSVAAIFVLTCLGNISLNLIFIPRFGTAASASIAVLTVYAVTLMYGVLYMRSVAETTTGSIVAAALQEEA